MRIQYLQTQRVHSRTAPLHAARRGIFLIIALIGLASCALPPDPAIMQRIEGIRAAALRRHIAELAAIGPRPPGDERAASAVRDYLRRELESYGYRVNEEKFFVPATKLFPLPSCTGGGFVAYTAYQVPQSTIFVERRGTVTPEQVVEVGAHYDTVYFTPGADDNSSGVAGVLEIARTLASAECEKTTRCCFFAAEEGWKWGLAGSREHVRRIRADGSQEVAGIIVLEMIGFASNERDSQKSPAWIPFLMPPSTGDFIAVVGNFSSAWLGNVFESAAERYVSELPIYSANYIGGFFADAARSDHASYWEGSLPAIMITDTADFRNPHYHWPSDRPETLDYLFLERVTRATAAALLEWAGHPAAVERGAP